MQFRCRLNIFRYILAAALVCSRCSFGTLCINIRCSSGAVFVQFGAVSVQCWCRLVHKYLNTCTQVPISTQVSEYKNTITTNHTTDNKPWKCVNENANHQAHPSSKASMTHQVWNNIPKKHITEKLQRRLHCQCNYSCT